ncbi:MAG TPA: hypothetical protein VJH97_03740 [Candidatus Nanoarchaeia archaeon]|nr:hypothetical protein [Candidatus Nanoarchaeia archaeon]
MLTNETLFRVQDASHAIMAKVLPTYAAVRGPRYMEVADFSLTNPKFNVGDTFTGDPRSLDQTTIDDQGLELMVITNQAPTIILPATNTAPAIKSSGYGSKALSWTAAKEGAEIGQYLPFHEHDPIVVLYREAVTRARPRFLKYLTPIEQLNPDFGPADKRGEFDTSQFAYYVPKRGTSERTLESIRSFAAKYGGEVIAGKGETFTVWHGDGNYIGVSLGRKDERAVDFNLSDSVWASVPAAEREIIPRVFRPGEIVTVPMVLGENYTIPPGHWHAVRAGKNGLFVLESSGESYDPGDLFLNRAIRRATKTLDDNKVVIASDFLEQKGFRLVRG